MKQVVWFVVMLLLSVSAAWSQEAGANSSLGFFIGAIGAYTGVAYQTRPFPTVDSLPGYFMVENGSDGAQFFGVTAEFPISESHHAAISCDLLLDSKSSSFVEINGWITEYHSRKLSGASLTATLTYLALDVGFKYNFSSGEMPNGLGIDLAGEAGIAVEHHFNQSLYYVWTDTTTWQSHSEIEPRTPEIKGLHTWRFSIRPILFWDQPISSRLILSPLVGYDAPLTQVDNKRNWTASSVFAGASLRYWVK